MTSQEDDFDELAFALASVGGLSHGCSIIISGVSAMNDFRQKFFPAEPDIASLQDFFCSSKNLGMIPYYYVGGLIACVPASFVNQVLGTQATIVLAGLTLTGASFFSFTAEKLPVFVLGRVMFGVAEALGSQASLSYLSLGPPKHRGMLVALYHAMVATAVMCGCFFFYFMCDDEVSWRWVFSIPGMLGFLMTLAGLVFPRQHQHLAGRTSEVSVGFRRLVARQNIPPLVMAVLVPLFQQLTGFTAIMTYMIVPSLRGIPGVFVAFTGALNFWGAMLALLGFGILSHRRRPFLLKPMLFSLVCLGLMKTGTGDGFFPPAGLLSGALLCMYVVSYNCSWGPLGWLIPSESFPTESRAAGQALAVAASLLFAGISVQSFPGMVCRFGNGVFLFYALWVIVMTAFVYLFVPEMNGDMDMRSLVWEKHGFWRRFYVRRLK